MTLAQPLSHWTLEPSISIITTDIRQQLFTVLSKPSRRSCSRYHNRLPFSGSFQTQSSRCQIFGMHYPSCFLSAYLPGGRAASKSLRALTDALQTQLESVPVSANTSCVMIAPYMPSVLLHSCLGTPSPRSCIHIAVATKPHTLIPQYSPSLVQWAAPLPSSSHASAPPMEQRSRELVSQQWVFYDQI